MKKIGLEGMTLFDELVNYAEEYFDGHFTVMKFTTNWRVGFGTPVDREDIDLMFEGKTFEEAAQRALDVWRSKGFAQHEAAMLQRRMELHAQIERQFRKAEEEDDREN